MKARIVRSDIVGVSVFGPTDHPHSVTLRYIDVYDDGKERVRYGPVTLRTYVSGAPWPVKGPGNHDEMRRKGEADGTYRPDLVDSLAIFQRLSHSLTHSLLYAEDLRKKKRRKK